MFVKLTIFYTPPSGEEKHVIVNTKAIAYIIESDEDGKPFTWITFIGLPDDEIKVKESAEDILGDTKCSL